MNNKNILLVGLVILIGACGIFFFSQKKLSNPSGVSDYKDATYQIEGKSVPFKDGHGELALDNEKTSYTYFGNEARGDFNNDGTEDVAFLLTAQGSGTGTFYYLVAALKGPGGYTGTQALFIGDRIAPQTTEFKEGRIIVNYADRKLDEPMTATQSVGVTKYFVIENGDLKSSR
jgi:hypothetical protein